MASTQEGFEESCLRITKRIEGVFFIITLNNPSKLNALTGDDFVYLGSLLDEANSNDQIYFTVLQGTGRYFSSGGDFSSITSLQYKSKDALKTWVSEYLSRDLYTCDQFYQHKKVLICCLNGPAVGLSAALVALCDIVYSINEKVFLLYPFSNLGLLTEGCTSVSLPAKLGNNISLERLIFSEPIKYDLLKNNIITKNYNMDDPIKFNEQVLKDLKKRTASLYLPSCLGMKQLIQSQTGLQDKLSRANANGVNRSLPQWVAGEPQRRFEQIISKQRIHKL
ncbi:hypothetical protein TBLA_0E01070 [Henningerozyma blattae CBS 6284]|uniref:Uncharacterized protein n=1 Tax=Henningerozyma blattae (strain ATCC 34711 / CBS 6284 / DSM 70876 / NBRC 10599 / NRRL Y-10934 / UCD 77-7) TaxID=1071380 RepID=I2H465_HENB6|nr:hypothetical protein TBLA_0E01070 [Tetrapisispora blattae CBS 6284]CCH61167.1 hypothetical protein TBLA_0E01070 [Tetrapisispora blattae CBS 6284]